MKLHELQPADGSQKTRKRVGRGIGSGMGKTSCRGMKGQKSRAGGGVRSGFEGGQMPLQRRLPKRGFKSVSLRFNAEITLSDLACLQVEVIDSLLLKERGLVPAHAKTVKVIKSGSLTKAVKLTGVAATAGARLAIEAAGGSIV